MIVFTKPCEKCGADVRSDEEHQCRTQKSKPARKPTTSPVTKTEASSISSPSSRRTVKPPEPVKHSEPVKHPDVKHVKQLPAGDRAAYMREYMRAYQRKKRAADRARQKAQE